MARRKWGRAFVCGAVLAGAALALFAGRLAGWATRPPVRAQTLDGARWMDAALEDLARGRLEQAAGKLRLVRWASSPGEEAGVLLAVVQIAQGQWAEALATLHQLPPAREARTRMVVEMLRGWAHQHLGQPAEAARAFGRALEADPGAAMAHVGLGLLAAGAARQGGGDAELERSWPNAGPSSSAPWLSRAEAHFERAARIAPDRVETLIELGRVRIGLERWPEALSALKQANRLDHRRAEVHFLLGVLYSRQGQRREAEAELRQALELDPQHPEARIRLEQLLAEPAP